jgi:hypothetical protein
MSRRTAREWEERKHLPHVAKGNTRIQSLRRAGPLVWSKAAEAFGDSYKLVALGLQELDCARNNSLTGI